MRGSGMQVYSQGQQMPVLDSRFITIAPEVFGTGKESIVIGTADGLPVAMGILHKTDLGTWQSIQPSQAPLGPWVLAVISK